MDVAASVVGLLMAGAHISNILGEFISSVKNVPALAQQLNSEVAHFRYILHKIQETVIDSNTLEPERAALIDINHLSSALTAAVCTFSELERELNRIKASGRIDFWDRIRWSRAEKTLLSISVRLNRHETSLTLIFTILTSESLKWALSSKEGLSSVFDAESLAASQADSIASSSTDGSISTMSTSTTASSLTSIGGNDFDSALSSSRAYRRASDSDSIFSIDTLRTRIGRWSMYTAYSNDSVFSLPVSLRETSGTTLADKAVGPVLLPINVDRIYQHERYQIDIGVLSPRELLQEISTPKFALAFAAEAGRHQEVRDLLRRGYSNDHFLPNGEISLDVAIRNQHEHTVEVLVKFVDFTWDWGGLGRRRLNQAIKYGNLAIVSTLLERVEIEVGDISWMEQMIRGALDLRDPSMITTIFKRVKDIPSIDTVLENLLLLPVAEKSRAALLVSGAVSAEFDMRSPGMRHILRRAVRHGAVAVIKALLRGGADVNDNDPLEQTLLHIAVEKEDPESVQYGINVKSPISGVKELTILKLLLEAGARVTATDHTGRTILHHAATFWTPKCLNILLDYTENINLEDENGETMLHAAAYTGREDVVRILLQHHADIEARNKTGSTPLALAASTGRGNMVQLLVSLGAKVNVSDDYGTTPLMRAARGGFASGDIYHVLVNNGANVSVRDNAGVTPLHLAAQFGDLWLIDAICQRGGNILARDSKGHTPVQWAINSDVARFITEWNGKLLAQATETL